MEAENDTVFAAIIAAGGSGSRFSAEKAKQFLKLRDIPLYAWSLRVLAQHDTISRLLVVAPSDMVNTCMTEIANLSKELSLEKPVTVIAGGKTRQASVFNGLKFLSAEGQTPDYVLIQDAARPFLDRICIDLVTAAAIKYGACTVGGAVSDTIKRVANGKITETLPREELIAVQTPQAGKFSYLLAAHQEAELSGFATTDDAALLEWAGHEVYVVEGPKYNIKVTQPLDLMLAEHLAGYLASDLL